ncbi:MAG TPA: ABC transporter ATP-binding protein [Actinoplanes sp.]|nr:ABC transporter ATP-binding protein [Actinoplanes sp.]
MSFVVETEHLAAGYDGREILRDVSLRVTAGDVVAVLGANGSGKSTLIRTILGLVPTLRGGIELFGAPQKRFRQWERIGYVPQRLGAGSGVPATVGEVVASGRLARRGIFRLPGKVDKTAVREALTAVGLLDRIDDPVATLSGGQQQRTLIARALAGQPDLLVLDEPNAGVDAASQEAFAGALTRFAGDGGTILVVLHELGPLRQLIGRAVVVHDGRIAHEGTPPEPAGHHAEPDHEHLHPHAEEIKPAICEWAPTEQTKAY